jgi:hypothetical protein
LKPWLPKYLPADVLAYRAEHDAFPHESTAEQFFQESQFESYRRLGQQIGTLAFTNSCKVSTEKLAYLLESALRKTAAAPNPEQ